MGPTNFQKTHRCRKLASRNQQVVLLPHAVSIDRGFLHVITIIPLALPQSGRDLSGNSRLVARKQFNMDRVFVAQNQLETQVGEF